uniref:Uncharacterized protein n=1 Tax=Acrobeloides nanus TaxID=290746 RepID=A0A914D3T7_9BILA
MAKIYLPFDNTRQYHPEYDSYTTGTVVKQADTVLLGYPLLVQMDPVVRKNDLIYYQSVTDGGGPAMTWAMHSIGWLEYGAEKNASDMFKKNFNYMRAPFNIWTETTSGVGSVNFVTGMGGFMHNLLQDSGSYSAIGVAYQGMSFTFDVNDTIVQVSLISAPKTGCVLVDENGKQFGLNTGVVFTGAIKTKRKITCNPSGSCSCPSGAWYQSTINPCNCYNFVKTPKDWKSANNDCQQQNSRSTLA